MGAKLYHRFTSGVADGTNTNVVRPQSNWNDTHDFYLAENAQTSTTYTIAASDDASLVTFNNASAVAVTLPQAVAGSIVPGTLNFNAGWFCWVKNLGASQVTITPTTSTIDSQSTLKLNQGQGAFIVSDGTNYQIIFDGGKNATITSGTIDNCVIGGTTPAAASVTAPAAGDSSARAITSAWFGQNMPGGYLNKFRNGTMDVWQRGTSVSVANATAYTADGWIVGCSGSITPAVTVQTATGRLLTTNAMKISTSGVVTDYFVKQRIEGAIAAQLASQTVTVQAWLNISVAFTPTITIKHAASLNSWTSPVTDVSAVNLQSCAANTWTLVAYTFTASSSAANGLEITIDFPGGGGSSPGTVMFAEPDIRVTPGVTTGLNSNPPPSELRPIATELEFCQRYFQTSYDNGTAPGSATHLGMRYLGPNSASGQGQSISMQVPLRAAPSSATLYDGAGNTGVTSSYASGSYNDNSTAVSVVLGSCSTNALFFTVGAAISTGRLVHFSASSEL